MPLVAPERGGGALQRQRQRRAAVGAQALHRRDGLRPAGGEAGAQAGDARALRERVEDHDTLGVGAGGGGRGEGARGRGVAVDLAVAFVAEQAEVVALGEGEQAREVGLARDGALRVRRRAEIGEGDAVEERRRQGGVVGKEAGLGGGGHRHQLGAGGEGAGAVGLVEGVGHEHDRAGAALVLGGERERGGEEALAGAVQREDAGCGVDRDAVPAGDPAGDGVEQLRRAVVGRVAAELGDVPADELRDLERHRVLRLADGHRELRPARARAGEQGPQPRKGVLRQVCEPRGELHRCASSPGSRRPPRSERNLASKSPRGPAFCVWSGRSGCIGLSASKSDWSRCPTGHTPGDRFGSSRRARPAPLLVRPGQPARPTATGGNGDGVEQRRQPRASDVSGSALSRSS